VSIASFGLASVGVRELTNEMYSSSIESLSVGALGENVWIFIFKVSVDDEKKK
jgi:hypothetical protein